MKSINRNYILQLKEQIKQFDQEYNQQVEQEFEKKFKDKFQQQFRGIVDLKNILLVKEYVTTSLKNKFFQNYKIEKDMNRSLKGESILESKLEYRDINIGENKNINILIAVKNCSSQTIKFMTVIKDIPANLTNLIMVGNATKGLATISKETPGKNTRIMMWSLINLAPQQVANVSFMVDVKVETPDSTDSGTIYVFYDFT